MNSRLVVGVTCLCALLSTPAVAQVDVGVSGAALLSIQPIDESIGGSPYLDYGIGGTSPGVAAGVSVITSGGFVMIGEVSTASYEQLQQGRLIYTRRDRFGSGTSDTHLRDTLVSGLIGYASTEGRQRFVLAGGASWVHTTLTEDGSPIDHTFTIVEEGRPFALTGAVEYQVSVSRRVGVLAGVRYTFVDRGDDEHEVGAGRHIIRILGGIRFRLTD
jgi:hypothetical protein